jgi:hypothetical protein
MGRITVLFQRVFKFTHYDKSALERLEGQVKFKFRAFWSVRGARVKPWRGSRGITPLIPNSAIDRREWSTSRSGTFIPLAVTTGLDVLVNIERFRPPGNQTPVLHPEASHYTDWATPATVYQSSFRFFLVSQCLYANAEMVPKIPSCHYMLLM